MLSDSVAVSYKILRLYIQILPIAWCMKALSIFALQRLQSSISISGSSIPIFFLFHCKIFYLFTFHVHILLKHTLEWLKLVRKIYPTGPQSRGLKVRLYLWLYFWNFFLSIFQCNICVISIEENEIIFFTHYSIKSWLSNVTYAESKFSHSTVFLFVHYLICLIGTET